MSHGKYRHDSISSLAHMETSSRRMVVTSHREIIRYRRNSILLFPAPLIVENQNNRH
uniref:Uncharacterized protein n=1 Tax=Rhizophagus irregularis (strain DAOM 181602 / DAOM 197198 / MUCL 43194) TaxID=747089 RepID=U9UCI5_RHIID